MKFHYVFHESAEALRTNLLRSVLTIIGIVVGIFSVTAMLGLGAGLTANVSDRFSSFILGDLTISGTLTPSDLQIVTDKRYVNRVLASHTSNSSVTYRDNSYNPTVEYVLGDYATMQKYTLVDGEVFNWQDKEYNEQVAVVSDGFITAAGKDSSVSPLNQTVTIAGQPFRVIGVISGNNMNYTRGDGMVFIPYASAVGILTNTNTFSSFAVSLIDNSYYEIAGADLLSSLNAAHQLTHDSNDAYSIQTAQSFIATAKQTISMITLFLGVVGGIALFVGGIGTMNMMLTTVTERTKEIGLRKAIGARDRDILLQILIESVLLTSIGGAIGILLTIGLGALANKLLAGNQLISIVVNMNVIALAAAVAVTVGVVFGLYPARNASRLQPVDALRAD
jgi:putative ABC transport system permease protein